jgi:predicted PurR-regulated permease PerM
VDSNGRTSAAAQLDETTAAAAGSTNNVDPAILKARRQWGNVSDALARVTPSQLAHFVLVAAAFLFIGWILWLSWTSFLPFQIGVVLAYITIPVVNALNKVMPRSFAVLLVILLEVFLALLFLVGWIPATVQEISRALQALPSRGDLTTFFDRLNQNLQELPTPMQTFVREWSQQTVTNIRDNLPGFVGQVLGVVANTALGIIGTLTFILSLLVLPTWLFAVLRDYQRSARALNRVLPASIRPDFWAVARILDRVLGVYVRGLAIAGFAVALAIYTGLSLLEWLGFEGIRYKLIFALVAGLVTLIPTFGPILGTIPAVAIASSYSAETGLAVLLLYLGVYLLNGWLLSPHLSGSAVRLHPAALAMVLVAGSQFGLVGLLLAAPIAVTVRDLLRYAYGRTSDPPRPAGVLPGEPVPVARPSPAIRGQRSARVS